VKINVTPGSTAILLNKVAQNLSRILISELTEDELLEMVEVFPAWEPDQIIEPDGTGYKWKGKSWATLILKYNGILYRVLQEHTTQNDWTPDVAVSLFAEVVSPGTIPVWVQSTCAEDAFNVGDQVQWPDGGTVWQSTIDANTTEPGTLPEHNYWVAVP
jgi:hypothetical protein